LGETAMRELKRFNAPIGGQEIQLQEISFEQGGMKLIRTRIRERSRFTVFDIDPHTALVWGESLLEWGRGQVDIGKCD
jgi:hypothetical protein